METPGLDERLFILAVTNAVIKTGTTRTNSPLLILINQKQPLISGSPGYDILSRVFGQDKLSVVPDDADYVLGLFGN